MSTAKPTTPKHADNRKAVRDFLEKIVVNAGVGRASSQPNFSAEGGGEQKKGLFAQIMRDLATVTGQRAEVRKATRSIAGFKVREGQIVGLRVTLRGVRMVDFFERLRTIVLPRVRDFSGISTHAVDPHGVLNIGFKEQLVFPEINAEESTTTFSLGVNIVPKKRDRAAALEAYRALGVPFVKREETVRSKSKREKKK